MDEPSEIERFKYTRIDSNGLIIIVHPNLELAAIVANRICKHCEIKQGDCFAGSARQDAGSASFAVDAIKKGKDSFDTILEQKCKPIEECTAEYMENLFAKQGGYFSASSKISDDDKEKLSMLTEESKARYLKKIKPLHFLPKKIIVDTNLPERIYTIINKFLVIQKRFFIWISEEKIPTYFKNCMLSMNSVNSTLRILCVSSAKLIPPNFYPICQTLFIFNSADKSSADKSSAERSEEKKELASFYNRAKLDCIIGSSTIFVDLMRDLGPRIGLVFQKTKKSTIDQRTGKKVSFETTEMFHAFDRRPRQTVLF
jgi:hypothetical protein